MKNITKFFAIAVVILGFSANAFAQSSATLNGTATANIMKGLTLANPQVMNFATLTITANVGTATLPASGSIASPGVSGGVTYFRGTPYAAEFSVTGDNSASITITIPTTGTGREIYLGGTSSGVPTETMVIDAFSSDFGTLTLSPTGTATFYVGATLYVKQNQTAGTYSNVAGFPVTVNYN